MVESEAIFGSMCKELNLNSGMEKKCSSRKCGVQKCRKKAKAELALIVVECCHFCKELNLFEEVVSCRPSAFRVRLGGSKTIKIFIL